MFYIIFKSQVKYVNAIKAWRPHSQKSDRLSVKGEFLCRKFQGILNKLTPQKFSALSDQALQLEINTEERLRECAEMVLSNVGKENSIMDEKLIFNIFRWLLVHNLL